MVNGQAADTISHNISIQRLLQKSTENLKRGANMEEKKKTELKIISMADVEEEEVEWLLYPFIPFGKSRLFRVTPAR